MQDKLYLECYAGISGDMMVAALLDLGADEQILRKGLKSLAVGGFQIEISRVKKAGLDACDFAVLLEDEYENHDHDMEYLHGASGIPNHHAAEEGTQNHACHHTHQQESAHFHGNTHRHRGLKEILSIIENADITPNAREMATAIFIILGEAEAKAHGVSLEEVQFHEVGAVDSIVDIVAVAVCMDNLKVQEVVIPVLYEGCGTIRCQHGILPIPVPAVSAVVSAHHLPMHFTNTQGEFVTPTGAAIAAAIATSFSLPDRFTVQRIGLGAGKRNYERPSLLRAMWIREETAKEDCIYKLESNIDDCTGEALGYVMEQLLLAGARDVHYMPVFMKKNRPAYQLNVICRESDLDKMEQIIFTQTTTIGIRRQRMERSVLNRRLETRLTSLGEVKVKVCELSNGERCYPEYSSLADICRKTGLPYQEVYQKVLREI